VQRTRNPWGHGERLRWEILNAASQLLSEQGSEEALTIRGVARAVGIVPASIYQHFEDKAALVRATIEHDYEQLTAAMRVADENTPAEDVVGRVRAQLHAYCQFAIDNPSHYRLMLAGRYPNAPEDPQRPLARIVDQGVAAFERCERAGVRLRVSPHRAAVIVFVAAHGRVALYHCHRAAQDVEEIASFVDELISVLIDPVGLENCLRVPELRLRSGTPQ
jgi:AcrR family transcriptional regulator